MGSLAETAVAETLDLGRRISTALRSKAAPGIWLQSRDATLGLSLSPQLVDLALANAAGADTEDVGNKLAFLILSAQPGSAVVRLIDEVAARAFLRAGAALNPYLDADDLRSLLRWRLWKLDVGYFNPARILKHPGLAAYVSVVARRIVIDEVRALGNRSRAAAEASELELLVDPREPIETMLDDLDLLHRLSAELPSWQRPIVGVLVGELDRADALSAINSARESEGLAPWTQDSLRTGIHRARARLRELLEQHHEPPQEPSPAPGMSVTSAPVHAWRRFWSRPDQSYTPDEGGFLVDPETEHGRYIQPAAVALDGLEASPCLVLLGEPGIGKSTTLHQERQRLAGKGYSVTFVDLARVSSLGALQVALQPALRRSAQPSFLILDGLDEGLARNSNLAADVLAALRGIDRARTRLRISSRTLEWPAHLELSLRDQWGTEAVAVYELLPLRLEDVLLAARNHRLDPDAFVACVREREVTPLAIRPISLRFLLEMFAADGTLPHSKARLFDEGSLVLCSEEGAWQRGRRRGNADVFRRRAIAARLAVLSTFTNSQVIDRSLSPPRGTLSVSAAVGGAETTAGATYLVDASAVEDVLTGTALFTARTGTSFGWSHQSYREFLTAWYLAQHDVPAEIVATLYFPRPRSRVPAALREVAAWHATLVPAIFELLLERDPEVLLHSDSGAASEGARAQLAEAILARLANFEAVDSNYWRRHYQRLAHRGLAAQLRPYIVNKGANIIVRRASMDIAWSCKICEVTDELIAVLRDVSDDLQARECAARALGQLGGPEVHELFRRSLGGELEPDPNDSIRGSMLGCLWPAHLDASSLFRAMSAPKRDDYTGDYQRFIDKVPGTLRPRDLPGALLWVEGLGDHVEYHLERAQQRIVDLALRQLEHREVLEPLCRIIYSSLRSHRGPWCSPRISRDTPRPALSAPARRAIIRELVRIAHSDTHLGFGLLSSETPLLLAEDVEWLAQCATASDREEVARAYGDLVACVYRQFGYPSDIATLDAVLAVSSPAFKESLASFLEPVELSSEAARTLREWWDQAQQVSADADHAKMAPARWPLVLPHLERVEAGEPASWIDLVLAWLQRYPTSIDKVPEWSQLPSESHDRMVAAALRFLNEVEAPKLTWLDDSGTIPWAAIAGRVALALICDVRRSLLDQISEAAWRRWCPVLVGVSFPEIHADTRNELLRRCNDRALEALNSAIIRIVRRDDRGDAAGSVLRDLPRPVPERLQAALLPMLEELKDYAFEDALELLVENGSTAALAHGIAAIDSALPGRAAAAARIVLPHEPSQWSPTIARMQRDLPFAEVLASLLDDDRPRSPLSSLTEQQAADLFLTLFRLAPPASRKPRRGGRLTALDQLSRLRGQALRKLVDAGTDAAIAALEWVIAQEPEHYELRWHLVDARGKHADAAWQPLAVSELWSTIRGAINLHSGGGVSCTITLQQKSNLQRVTEQLRVAIPGVRIAVAADGLSISGSREGLSQLQEAVEATPALRDAILSIRVGEEWMFEAVPQMEMAIPMPATRYAGHHEIERLVRDVHVLVETATDLETRALQQAMAPLPGEDSLVVGSLDVVMYTIGRLGSYAVAHLQTDMGAEGPNGAQLATSDAVREINPKTVFLVGIAFGIHRAKQRLGDVLVAQYVTSYETAKLRPESLEERGENLRGNTVLCERVKVYKRSWEFLRADKSQVDVYIGQILSGAKLVNNREFRDSLARRFPAALGGEMEGVGAYAAAFRKNVPVLLVKGICDWADGLKNDRAQPFAAAAAVSFVRYILSKPDALRALDIPVVEETPEATALLVKQHLDTLRRRWEEHRPLGVLSGRMAWSSDVKSSDVFVLPRIRRRGQSAEAELRADTILERARGGASVALLGNVGSGKSTLLQWCAAELASNDRPGRDPIPILVHARDLRERSWTEVVQRVFPTAHGSLASSRWVLLVDGIDEVGIGVWSTLATLRREQPAIVGIVAASRPATSPAAGEGLESLELVPWSQLDVERFLNQWSRGDSDAVDRVRTQLGGRVGVDLLSNPLTATAALLIASERRTLPQSRAGIVGCVAQLLFQTWRREREGPVIAWEDVQGPLVELAMQSIRGESLTIEHVRRAFAAGGYAAAISLSDEVERQMGVLVRRDERHFDFVLRAVAEHLVGESIRSQPRVMAEMYARASWGHEVVRHAVGISADRGELGHANELLRRICEVARSALHDMSALRALLSAIDTTADLSFAGVELAPTTIDAFADVVMPALLEETSTWLGDRVAERVRRVVEAGGAVWEALLSRAVAALGPSQANPVAWYARAQLTVEGWFGALFHRDAGVRAIAVDRLGEHLEREDVRGALLFEISDEGHDFGNAPPAVRAGLLWRTIPRGPHTVEPVRYLNRLVTSWGQTEAGAAALALLPVEASPRELARALMSLSQACYLPRCVVDELRSSDEGRRAVDELWPAWATRVQESVTRDRHERLQADVLSPPPSELVRSRVVRAFGPRLGELDSSTFSVIQSRVHMAAADELVATGHIERVLHRSPNHIPVEAQLSLGALLLSSPQARAHVLAQWPPPEGRMYPGIALEPLIEAGDPEATRVYAEWLPRSPYNWGFVRLHRAPSRVVLENLLVLPVARRLVMDVIERVHVPDAEGSRLAVGSAATVLWSFSAAWCTEASLVERVWSIADADEEEGLRGLLIATDGVELDSTRLADLHRRVHASLEATCPSNGGHVDSLRALRAERKVMWLEERGFVLQSQGALRVLAGLRHPVGWLASAVLWPILTDGERVDASQRIARDAIASDFVDVPETYLERFVRVAPGYWCSVIVRTVGEYGSLAGTIGVRALQLLPRELQLRVARVLRGSQLADLELPWKSAGAAGRYERDADTVRRILFDIGDDPADAPGST